MTLTGRHRFEMKEMLGSLYRPLRIGSVVGSVALMQACASPSAFTTSPCEAKVEQFESMAVDASIWLSEPRNVPAFPGLGSNRQLASFDPTLMTEGERIDLLQRAFELGKVRRQNILQAMDPPLRKQATVKAQAIDTCVTSDLEALLDDDHDTWRALHAALQIPDDYLGWRRFLGLYPLTAQFAKFGVRALHEEIHTSYATPIERLPIEGALTYYAPSYVLSPKPEAQRLAVQIQTDSLGVLRPESGDLDALIAQHAPVWSIDTVGHFDLPGVPFYSSEDVPRVDTSAPTVYTYASFTRFAGRLRLQLNYVLWFDARPLSGPLDTLGGRLDGLVWRVTLDDSGEVLAYDSIHPCGCYHLMLPSAALATRPEALQWPEPPLVVQEAPQLRSGERILLRLASTTHYLMRVSTVTSNPHAEPYALKPYSDLYRVKGGNGVRSLFNASGIVAGTGRKESLYLWPMGIRAPGAMRERGRQATAFVGRRHFDDAEVLERVFEPR